MPKKIPLIVAGAIGLSSAVSSAANPPVAQEAPKASLMVDPCLTEAADQKKTLVANDPSVRIVQPNVTPLLTQPQSSQPPRACKLYLADFDVPSSSHPPAGFKDTFTVSGTYDAGKVVYQNECANLKVEVKIYKKSGNGFSWLGGGKLVTTWHAATTTPTVTPASCEFSEGPGYKAVSAKVPSAGTDTYRVMLGGGLGSAIAKIARSAK